MLPSHKRRDIVEIYIQLGQIHPKGLPWYSVVEWVILFQPTEEMPVMVHGVIKAMAFCEEPIQLRMSPSATHVKAFMAARGGEPSGTQPPIPNEGRNLCHPLMIPPRWEDPTSISGRPWGSWVC